MVESVEFEYGQDYALAQDEADPLRHWRDAFHIPVSPAHENGRESIYLCGNSLGCMPRCVREEMSRELDDWATLGVEGHFKDRDGWYGYHELMRETAARLVGARAGEVVMMNSLTVNLHLLMASFYRPTSVRYRILIDGPCFPSDVYAVKSQLRWHLGADRVEDALLWIRPGKGEHHIRTENIESLLDEQGDSIALVLLAGVNYYSGQHYDMPRLTHAAHRQGCVVGWDLAHAAGNVPLHLHDWDVDFAAWCTYKYLNSGPGAVAGAFVHQKHIGRADFETMPRFEGWWGNDPSERFAMRPEFIPKKSAEAWQLSNPPILSMVPVRKSLAMFDEVGLPALRAKSERLTGYLEWLIGRLGSDRYQIITPSEPAARGCQLSILAHQDARGLFRALQSAGVICDYREPNVIRVAPVPFYNTYQDVWTFARILEQIG